MENGTVMTGRRFAPILILLCLSTILQPTWADKSTRLQQAESSADPPPVLPIRLDPPSECAFASAYALNNGAYPQALVVAGSVHCGGSDSLPYTWQNGSWSPVNLPVGNWSTGYAESVSDDLASGSTLAFHIFDEAEAHWKSWAQSAGQQAVMLASLPDMGHIGSTVLSAEGNHIVGANSTQELEHATRWTRNGSDWLPPEDLGPGEAAATTEDGQVVVGSGPDGAWVWTANPAGGGERVALDSESTTNANDITHDGSMIVGSRRTACPNTPDCTYPIPVFWVVENNQWVMHDLQALDNVDSEAKAVALVGDQALIVGFGFTNQDGGILRPVAWIPETDGSYGPPLRLEALAGNFDSWAEAIDVNRNGIVLGWSEIEPFAGAGDVLWNLLDQFPFQINAGLNDAWFNPDTDGQGFFVTVFPDIGLIFLAWFTYDTERPDDSTWANLGEPGHRWLTAFGSYSSSQAVLEIEMTEGGVFDSHSPVPTRGADGTITLEFSSCNAGTVTYDISSIGRQGTIPIERVALDNVPMCETLRAKSPD